MILVTFLLCYLSQTWMFNKLTYGEQGLFVEQMLILSSSFRCDQTHNKHYNGLGHTLLSYLSMT
jgi:hypothetical protein